ncbi:hypothetical protein AAIH51_34815 [Pseudomonas aeruginosa]
MTGHDQPKRPVTVLRNPQLLPIACTIGAIFGSLAQTIIANYNLNSLPRKEGEMKSASPQLQEMRSAWLFLRLFVGGVLGFVVGLYFVGALQETPAVFAKIWALSFVVGYAAPKIWVVQERNLLNRIDSSLDQPEKASTGVPD